MTSSQPEMEASGPANDSRRLPLEPLDPQLTSIQPGGGVGMRIELLWGRWRRWWLRTFRRGYVQQMAATRRGDVGGCPHEVLDPRDLKFYRNVSSCLWDAEHDRFAWRDRLPFARAGLAELLLMSGGCAVLSIALAFLFWPVALIPAVFGLFFLWFFRNPRRAIPQDAGLVVSPADGKVVAVEEIDHDPFINGPAVLIGIFLSVFNVHVNRSPVAGRVIGLTYRRGKFLNALRAASAVENEQLAVRLEENFPPYRRIIVRQIAGAIARRIVCWLKPGDELERGELFGMIKLGSRTELVLPREPGLKIEIKLGQNVRGGATVIARYENGTP
jgi:phosphatidylserine decarboxylase